MALCRGTGASGSPPTASAGTVRTVSHPVPDLTCLDVESALGMLGYVEPGLDCELPEDAARRVPALLATLLAVTEAHLRARQGDSDDVNEVYLAVCDHLAEEGCLCAFGARAA